MHFNDYQAPRKSEEQIYGIRPIIEAIHANKEIEKIYIQKGLQGPLFSELRKLIHEVIIPFQYVPIEKLDRVTKKNHQGIIAIVSQVKYQTIESILPMVFEQGKNPLIVVLDRITDVRNMGAIARTAECAGVDALIIPSRGAAQINADAIKTSAGALHRLNVCRSENLKDTLQYLKDSGLQLIGCTEKTETPYISLDYTMPTAIIMGSEEDGISEEYLKLCTNKAMIPLLGAIGSLNVSVANGIILYEVLKQRN